MSYLGRMVGERSILRKLRPKERDGTSNITDVTNKSVSVGI